MRSRHAVVVVGLFVLFGCSSSNSSDQTGPPASAIDSGNAAEVAPPAPPSPQPMPEASPPTSEAGRVSEAGIIAEASSPVPSDAAADRREAAPAPLSDAALVIPGLVAQYDFEDPANLGREDVARADSVEIYNAAQVAGHVGQGIAFSGGYLLLPGITKFQLAAFGDFSLEVWIKTDQRFANNLTNLHFLTCATSTSHSWGLAQLAPDNAPQFMVYGVESALGTTDVYDGAWHHVVGTRASQTLKIYADGKLEGTTVATMPIADHGCTIALGRDGACCENFTGTFDRARLWSRALTDAEVLALSKE